MVLLGFFSSPLYTFITVSLVHHLYPLSLTARLVSVI